MKKITSVTNPIIKEVLDQKSGKSDYIIVDGIKLITDAINNGIMIEKLFISSDNCSKYLYLTKCAKESYEISDNVLSKLSYTNSPQGIMAQIVARKCDFCHPIGNCIVLDHIQDPGNLGTIIRTALAANYTDVICIDCASHKSDKVVRASAGAIMNINVVAVTKETFCKTYSAWGLPLYCADMDGKDIYDFVPAKQYGIVIGNEGQGVSCEIQALATDRISIPMNSKIESLNAGVSASIIMYLLASK